MARSTAPADERLDIELEALVEDGLVGVGERATLEGRALGWVELVAGGNASSWAMSMVVDERRIVVRLSENCLRAASRPARSRGARIEGARRTISPTKKMTIPRASISGGSASTWCVTSPMVLPIEPKKSTGCPRSGAPAPPPPPTCPAGPLLMPPPYSTTGASRRAGRECTPNRAPWRLPREADELVREVARDPCAVGPSRPRPGARPRTPR